MAKQEEVKIIFAKRNNNFIFAALKMVGWPSG